MKTTTAEVTVRIDLANASQKAALDNLFEVIIKENKVDYEKQSKATKTKAVPKTESQSPKEEKAKAPVDTAKNIGINDVRAAVAKKAATHRNEMKAKLKELGAANVTKLSEEKYTEFWNFLEAL
jgi:chromatin remodeling complex protein RSC6